MPRIFDNIETSLLPALQQTLEITDLGGPGSPLHEAGLRTGARPWSRVVTRLWHPARA